MYINLEQNEFIIEEEIKGIFDIDKTTVSKKTREWIRQKEKEKKVIYTSYELPKSFIICEKNGEEIVYISQLSPITIIKRINSTHKY